MRLGPLRFPSRAHAAGTAALLAGAALFPASPHLAIVPLAAFVLACFTATQFPTWSFFLPVVLHGSRARPEVALTFDDGPDPRTWATLLELLAAEGVPATFFVVGRRVAAHPEALRAILAAGHEVGNHSQSHDVFLAARPGARIRREVLACQEVLAGLGVRPRAFRPPVGITSPPMARALEALGLRCVAFSCRPLDFGNRRLDDMAERVLRRVRPGDIILLHDALPAAVPVETWRGELVRILAGLRERGLRVVPLSALLGEPVMEHVPAAAPAALAPGPRRASTGSWGKVAAIQAAFTLGYPLLVVGTVGWLGARNAALVLLALLIAGRAGSLRRDMRRARGLLVLAASVMALLVAAAVLNDPRFLLAYPTLVNAVLLAQFAWSLRGGRSMAERFARLEVDDLSAAEIRYCCRVTLAWCAFFALNGGACTLLALTAPPAWWAVYAGGVSYVLVGALFAAEYVVRKARFGRFGPGIVDRTLARFLGRGGASP
jgi:peptidoglycan/xylan/chitin deacetylase (PgdA/CDA1 family)/uncharacterized membrane protein